MKSRQALILAGGLATRLQPLTVNIPKSLISIRNQPFIAHQLRLLKSQNIQEVIICVGFLGDQIQAFVKNGEDFDLNVKYSYENEKLLGTGGAIKNALPLLDDIFFVIYGDSYLKCDYSRIQEYFIKSQKLGLMTVYQNEGSFDTSNVRFENNEIITYDKVNRSPMMRHIDYGLGIFQKKAFDLIEDNTFFDLALFYQNLLKLNQLAAFEVTERFYEIGSFSGIQALEQYLS